MYYPISIVKHMDMHNSYMGNNRRSIGTKTKASKREKTNQRRQREDSSSRELSLLSTRCSLQSRSRNTSLLSLLNRLDDRLLQTLGLGKR